MANKKIKHIIAKVVGSSTEETMDVYDVDAVHTADVINNLTSNTEAAKKKPLSAYQGYVLNNNLTQHIIAKTFTFGYTIAAGAALDVTSSDLGTVGSVPSGYLLLGVRTFHTGSNHVVPSRLQFDNASNIACVRLINVGTASTSATLTVAYNFIRSGYLSNQT